MTLEAGTQSVDTSIDAAKKACITLFYDNRVKRHLKPISLSSTEDRVAQVEIHSTINAMVAITDEVTETMLLYLDDQYVFSDGLYSFEDCFNTLYSFADYDADYWRSLLGQAHYAGDAAGYPDDPEAGEHYPDGYSGGIYHQRFR